MTTNGTLVRAILPELVEAGLDEINISLDTLDPEGLRPSPVRIFCRRSCWPLTRLLRQA